jgi:hypothetical protein
MATDQLIISQNIALYHTLKNTDSTDIAKWGSS